MENESHTADADIFRPGSFDSIGSAGGFEPSSSLVRLSGIMRVDLSHLLRHLAHRGLESKSLHSGGYTLHRSRSLDKPASSVEDMPQF